MSTSTPHTQRLRFEVDGLDVPLRVTHVSEREVLSELYEIHVTALCTDQEVLAFDAIVGKSARLTLQATAAEERVVGGIVSRFQQAETSLRLTTYHATLVPRAWLLLHRHDCRIFQEKTVPEILTAVLEEAGFAAGKDYRLALAGEYVAREYCVQYRESCWAFLRRLMAEEGIFSFFEEDGRHLLVLADSPGACPPIPGDSTVLFRTPAGLVRAGDQITKFRYAEEIRAGKVTLRDYNFEKPDLLLESQKAGASDTDLEVYDYSGRYDVPSLGDRRARIQLEQILARRQTGEGESSAPRLAPGYVFTLKDHPRSSFDRAYLVTSVEHRGREARMDGVDGERTAYENRFTCIPAEVVFRPEPRPRPVIQGVQSAVVVGPPGEEIYPDEYGRVRVQFPWDRQGKDDEHSTCWLRVSQSWAGAGFGTFTLPRVGQEVLVGFVDGDPDRPVVIGSVFNAKNVVPYKLPEHKTRSVWKSRSSPGGDGFNELTFDDAKGEELFYAHAEKDLRKRVKHDESERTGNDHAHTVVGAQDLVVKGVKKERIEGDSHVIVSGAQSRKVEGKESLIVQGSRHEKVFGRYAVEGGDEIHLSASESLTIKGPGGFITLDASGITIQGILVRINCGRSDTGMPPTPTEPERAAEIDDEGAL